MLWIRPLSKCPFVSGHRYISFCLHQVQLAEAYKALTEEFYLELKEDLLSSLDIIEQLAIISIVGDGMRTFKGISARFFLP